MKNGRYTDAQLRLMTRAAAALEPVMAECGYRDLLYGKWALLTREVEAELAERERERRTMFAGPDVQLANLARWNRARGWGFTVEQFEAAAASVPEPPAEPDGGALQLKARVLEIGLPAGPDGAPGHRRTFDELWDIVALEQGAIPCHLMGLATAFGMTEGAERRPVVTRLDLAPGETHRPGLRWRTIDFGHGWPDPDPACAKLCGLAPRRLPRGTERAHAGILSAAAHFPLWLARMDGKNVPYAWLPGYRLANVPGETEIGKLGVKDIAHHPRITRGRDGRPFLYMGWDHVPFDDHAVPVYADTKTDP